MKNDTHNYTDLHVGTHAHIICQVLAMTTMVINSLDYYGTFTKGKT